MIRGRRFVGVAGAACVGLLGWTLIVGFGAAAFLLEDLTMTTAGACFFDILHTHLLAFVVLCRLATCLSVTLTRSNVVNHTSTQARVKPSKKILEKCFLDHVDGVHVA